MYTIEISGTPMVKPRPRGFKTKSGHIAFYTPAKSKNYEHLIRERAEKIFKKPLQSSLSLTVIFLMPRPGRLIWKNKPMPICPCDKRPDIDNLLKIVTDGLNGVAYTDDGQVSVIHAFKRYHAGGEGPKTIIKIEEDKLE